MPKYVDHDERRKHIAEATWNVINRDGPENLTMIDVAREAGFTTGALLHYFRYKEELIRFAFEAAVQCLMEQISEDSTQLSPGFSQFRAALISMLPNPASPNAVAQIKMCYWMPSSGKMDLFDIYQQRCKNWKEETYSKFQEAVKLGQLKAGPSLKDDFDAVITFVDGLCIKMIADPEHCTIKTESLSLDKVLSRLFLVSDKTLKEARQQMRSRNTKKAAA